MAGGGGGLFVTLCLVGLGGMFISSIFFTISLLVRVSHEKRQMDPPSNSILLSRSLYTKK